MARSIKHDEQFQNKLLKLIPSEIVAAYIALNGMAQGIVIQGKDETLTVEWVILGLLLVITPFYLRKSHKVCHWSQIVLTTIALPIWIYTIGDGGPFSPWHNQQLASILLVLWTLIVPLFVNPKDPDAVGESDGTGTTVNSATDTKPGT